MIILKSILFLSLVQYGFAAPSTIASLQNVGVDKAPVRLSSDQSARIKQELDHPINERDRDEYLFDKIAKRDRIRYHVPRSPTTISVRLGPVALTRDELLDAITSTIIGVRNVLNAYGDGPLPANSNPYSIRFSSGLLFRVNRTVSRQLTYQILFESLRGLLEVLVNQNHYNEANFEIVEAGIGRVGHGNIFRLRNP